MAKLFSLEAVFAKKGDSLLLHYGSFDDPQLIVIDGGPRGVYKKFLRPRLMQIRDELAFENGQSLPIRMVMVSHIDDDHIAGVIDLFEELQRTKELRRPQAFRVDTLWHNSFDEILGNRAPGIVTRMVATAAPNEVSDLPLPRMTRESRAVVASTKQGRTLRDAAKKLRVPVNVPFNGLITAPHRTINLDSGLKLTVIGPDEKRVAELQKEWDEDLKKIQAKERDSARASAFADNSPFNLASICVLAELDGKRMLLTGDARGDHVLSGLRGAKLLRGSRPVRLELLKVPHHGSDRNVEPVFFERVIADHYIISGDGEHGNPEVQTLEMLAKARGTDSYSVHFTFTKDAHRTERNAKRKKALRKVADWVDNDRPRNCAVTFQDPSDDENSIIVDLLTPLYET